MYTLIKNGTILTASDTYRADLLIKEEQIAAIGTGLQQPGARVIDATGHWVMPGGIDVHTHIDMPFMGTSSSDDFETGTVAAAYGGTTCVVDFAIPEKGKSMQEALRAWKAKAAKKAVIDYGFHMCVVEMGRGTLGEMEQLVEKEGVTSFKLFTDYPGVFQIDDGAIFRVLQWAKRSGALIQIHAVNGQATAVLVEEAAAAGRLDPIDHGLCRPSRLEGEATARVIALAEVADAPIYIVHLTCDEALQAVSEARRRDVKVFAETCPQYLYLDHQKMALADFEGAKYVCNPPIRPPWHAEKLWLGLRNGDLQTVATDHCPFNFEGQKELGRGDFRKIPNGLPGIETRMALMYQGVVEGKITANRFVDLVSTRPAKLFGLYPRKGAVLIGADADLVLWNPRRQVDLSVEHLHMRVDHSIYEGIQVQGGPDKVLVRGELAIDGDTFVGKKGRGRFIRRDQPLF